MTVTCEVWRNRISILSISWLLVQLGGKRRAPKGTGPLVHSDGHQHLFLSSKFSEFSVNERIERVIANKENGQCLLRKERAVEIAGLHFPEGLQTRSLCQGSVHPGRGEKGMGLARARGRLMAHTGFLILGSVPAACSSKFDGSSDYHGPQIRADQVRSLYSSQISFASLASSAKMLKS